MANKIGRPDASSGKGYFVDKGTVVTTGPIAAGTFYQIIAKGETSGFAAGAAVNHVYYTNAGITLGTGDQAYVFTITAPNSIQGMTRSGSRSEADVTAQNDANKTYISSRFSEESGEISGVFDINDAVNKTIIERFIGTTDITDADAITETNPSAQPIYMIFSRNDLTELAAGEDWVVEWMPMSITGYSFDKPFEGGQPFNFNYRLLGNEFPSHIRITKPA